MKGEGFEWKWCKPVGNDGSHWEGWKPVGMMEADGHLSLRLFYSPPPQRIVTLLVSGERDTWHLGLKGLGSSVSTASASTSKSTNFAKGSASSQQNRTSCFQDNVFIWLIKGFLEITSLCNALF